MPQVFARRDREFFDLFEQAAENALRAAETLEELVHGFPDTAALAANVRELEHEGDRITHTIHRRLNQSNATPIDREGVLELTSALDDLVDLTEEVADFMVLYKVEAPMDPAVALSTILKDCCREIAVAVPRLGTSESIADELVEIHRLENDGDRVSREGIASLFEHGVDPMVVIRWKDIFERLEEAVDAAEHVADVLDGIAMRHG